MHVPGNISDVFLLYAKTFDYINDESLLTVGYLLKNL